MKSIQKIAALTLSAVMSLTLLTACGGGGTTTESTAPSASAAPSAASTPAKSEAPATSDVPDDDSTTPTELKTVEPGKLHMSTNAAFPPYEMVTDDGSFEGIDVEIADAIAKELGLELVVDDMGFDAALLAAQNGQSDIVMAGVTVKPDRQEVLDFTDTYATGVQVVIVPEDSPIETVEDLSNAEMIGTQKSTTGYQYCSAPVEEDGFGEDHVTAYETGALAVQALVNHQVDAVVIDNEPAKAYVEANPGLKILPTAFTEEDYAIGLKKGNTALLNAINDTMAKLKKDGTIQKIVDKYISAD